MRKTGAKQAHYTGRTEKVKAVLLKFFEPPKERIKCFKAVRYATAPLPRLIWIVLRTEKERCKEYIEKERINVSNMM